MKTLGDNDMKRIVICALVSVFFFSLVACDKESGTTTVKNEDETIGYWLDSHYSVEATSEPTEETTESTAETTEDNHYVDTIEIASSECEVRFVGIESADRGLLEDGFNDDVDLDKVIMLKFEYKNLGEEGPEQFQQDYWVDVYQNGVSIWSSISLPERNGNRQWELWHNQIASVLPGGSLTYGVYYELNDDSPIQLYVTEYESGDYQIMELDVSNYVR